MTGDPGAAPAHRRGPPAGTVLVGVLLVLVGVDWPLGWRRP
jgi:hypothetical protein